MRRGLMIVILAVLLLTVFVVYPGSVGGFTGTTAQFDRVTYGGNEYAPTSATTAIVDITEPAYVWPVIDNPAGITAQIAGQPQTTQTEHMDDIIVDNGDGTNDVYKWERRTMEFGVDFQNSGDGTLSATNMEFWITLQNNYRSVYLDATTSFGYVTEAWVKEYEVLQKGTSTSILPSARGTFFELYSVEDKNVVSPPKAFAESLDLENLAEYSTVQIKFTVDNFRPYFFPGTWVASHVYITLSIRVIVLGLWENVVPGHTAGPAPNEGWNLWDALMGGLGMLLDVFLGPLFSTFMIIIFVIVAGIVIIKMRGRNR